MPSNHDIRRGNEIKRHARAFLADQLASGPRPMSVIREQAAKQGISLSMLLAAKLSLHVDSHIIDKRSIWSLPKTP